MYQTMIKFHFKSICLASWLLLKILKLFVFRFHFLLNIMTGLFIYVYDG